VSSGQREWKGRKEGHPENERPSFWVEVGCEQRRKLKELLDDGLCPSLGGNVCGVGFSRLVIGGEERRQVLHDGGGDA
jgi:hypothetical protein